MNIKSLKFELYFAQPGIAHHQYMHITSHRHIIGVVASLRPAKQAQHEASFDELMTKYGRTQRVDYGLERVVVVVFYGVKKLQINFGEF